jgi:radical SAM protein with 4Fe4S-binding SPASM domain
MSLDFATTVTKNMLSGMNIGHVVLIGGEPTIHPQFFDFVRMLRDNGQTIAVVTNSLRFANEKFLLNAVDAGVSNILTSFKAGDEQHYAQATRVPGAFAKVRLAMKNIESSPINHEVSIIVTEGLKSHFDSMLQAITDSNVKRLLIDTERPVMMDQGLNPTSFPDCRQTAEFIEAHYDTLVGSGLDFLLKITIPFCNFSESFIERVTAENRLSSGCHIYRGTALIFGPHGELLPCNHLPENEMGAFGTDFWDAKSYLEFRQRTDITEFYQGINKYPDVMCTECPHWQQCGAGCKIQWLTTDAKSLMGHYNGARAQRTT